MTDKTYHIYHDFIELRTANDKEMLHSISIYTDGSKINNLVSCVFVVYDIDHKEIYNRKINLNNEATVYMAEMVWLKRL